MIGIVKEHKEHKIFHYHFFFWIIVADYATYGITFGDL